MSLNCPLCNTPNTTEYHQDKKRQYWQCQQCALVFVAPECILSHSDEKAIYDTHENSFADEGYQRFLSRAAEPLLMRLKPACKGLDFGCGPAPVLAKMIESHGHQVALYDIYYQANSDVLEHQYDFITCTEAIEHFVTPAKEWQLLTDMLRPGGILVIMTKLVINVERFANWHYKNDMTHVSFFSRMTFEYLAKRDGLTLEYSGDDVMLFKKHELS